MKKILTSAILALTINAFAQSVCTNDTIPSIKNTPVTTSMRTVAYNTDIYAFGDPTSAYKYSTTNDSWIPFSNMPTVRGEIGTAEVNGVIYCLGGWSGTPSYKNEAYTISTNTWSTMANVPSAITGCFAVSLNNMIYIFGGTLGTTTSSFYQYNPSTNTYKTLAIPAQSRMQAGLVVYNNKIYLVGGHYYNGSYNSSNKLDEYDPTLNTWTSKANIPISIQRSNGTIYDNKLYLFGGTTATPTITPLNSFYVYDFVSNTWTTMKNMPFTRASLDPKTVNGMVYLFGGNNTATTTTNLCYKYYCKDYICQKTIYDTVTITKTLTDTIHKIVYDTIANRIPTNGLVGWYPFNGNAKDASGKGNNGTVNGATLTTDRFGNANSAYSFDGITNNIAVPNIAVTGNAARSIFVWIKTSYNAGKTIIGTGGSSANAGEFNMVMGYGPGSIQQPGKLGVMGGNFTTGGHDYYPNTGTNVNDNKWHFVGATFDGNTLNLYKDDTLINTTAITYNTIGQTNFFGYNNHNGSQWNGMLDDIGIWNRVLNASEIASLYKERGNVQLIYDTVHVIVNDTVKITKTITDTIKITKTVIDTIKITKTITDTIHKTVTDTIHTTQTAHLSVTDTLVIKATLTGIAAPKNTNTLKVYPNPAKDHITINYGDYATMSGYTLKIVNTLGITVFTTSITQQTSYIDLQGWNGKGIYYVHIIDAQNKTIDIRQIVIE